LPPIDSIQPHSRKERNGAELTGIKIPLSFLLEYTFIPNSMLKKYSVQARFGSVCLIATIEQFDPSFSNSGNQIAIKKDIRMVRKTDNFSVGKFPIFMIGDCMVHLALDLTHGGNP